ncbi:MAG: hypothetical protein ACE5JP_09580 [Candidatus Bipolaricaulia bacterium]
MIDVSPLVPEARQTVIDAAHVYLEHTRPWFIGLLIHGSALKGGFIPVKMTGIGPIPGA